jgi:hypothetical protein
MRPSGPEGALTENPADIGRAFFDHALRSSADIVSLSEMEKTQ